MRCRASTKRMSRHGGKARIESARMNLRVHLHNRALRPPPTLSAFLLPMDKSSLQQQVLDRLAEDLLRVETAARVAHETATHEENIAENKYDTLGLEAAYLATGQARRAEAIRQAITRWRHFRPGVYDADKGIQVGALVTLMDADEKEQRLFIGPDGGSMQLMIGGHAVQVVSTEAPLCRAMLGKTEGDEVSLQIAATRQQFEVLSVE